MKTDIQEYAAETAAELQAVDHHLPPQSLARFQENDRAWPVELWIKVREPVEVWLKARDGEESRMEVRYREDSFLLEMVQIHPDPCDPGAGESPLHRKWRKRNGNIQGPYMSTISECPERIIAGCRMETWAERCLATFWEMGNGMEPGHIERERPEQENLERA